MPDDTDNERIGADTKDTATADEDEPCRLKRLPAEIRNEIFLLAVIEPEPIRLVSRCFTSRAYKQPGENQMAGLQLASTCRQFHEEVELVFYAENTFTLRSTCFPGPTRGLAFPLNKTTKLIPEGSDIQAFCLRVNKAAENTLEIKILANTLQRCACHIEHLAQLCRGRYCPEKITTTSPATVEEPPSRNNIDIVENMCSSDPSSATIPSRPDPESNPLTRLPAELRNNIFTKAITEDQPIRLKFESTEDGSYTPALAYPDTPLTGLALAKTCHQFRQEVLSMLCAVNSISLDLPTGKYLSAHDIPGYLSKTPPVIINLDDFDRAGGRIRDAARINIRQRAGRIVGWDVEGNLEGRCVCSLKDVMIEGQGRLCATRFVVEFERRMVRVRHRWPLEVLRVCKKCERERTFTKWNACF